MSLKKRTFSSIVPEQAEEGDSRCTRAFFRFFFCFTLCLLLIFPGACPASFAQTEQPEAYVTDLFTDVTSADWFADAVQKAWDRSLMQGTGSYTFSPDEEMNRAMFVQLLYNMNGKQEPDDYSVPFKDVDTSAWYYSALCWAYHNNVVSGISDDHFAPEGTVTREQAAQILYSSSGSDENAGALTGFSDAADVDGWAADGMKWAAARGIISGSSENGGLYLRPRDSMKRSEAAQIIVQYYNYKNHITNDEKTVFPEETHLHSWQMDGGVKIPVLEYHEVSDNTWGDTSLFVSPSNMRKQLEWLRDNGYDPIFFSDVTHLRDYDKPILLTFDDGYVGNYENLFPLLKEFNMKATCFVVTGDIDNERYLTSEQIREMSDSGLVSIQSHTNSHSRVDWLTDDQLIREFQVSKTRISKITGKSPYVLSYPEGRDSAFSRQAVRGFFSAAVYGGRNSWVTADNLYNIPRKYISRTTTMTQFKKIVER